MKTLICFFTGTGNNLWTAIKLKEQLGNAEIQPIRHLRSNKEISMDFTHIIFVVPSYYSHIPPFVELCLSDVVFHEEQTIITIVDCGGNRGKANEDLREAISKCGKNVSGEYMIVHPGSYILSYGAFPKIYQKITTMNAKRYIRKIADDIRRNKLKEKKHAGMLYKEKEEKRLQEAISAFSQTGLQYEVSDACVSCGVCKNVCPVQNIQIDDGRPVFNENCQQCMACIQWCPKRAIDYKEKAGKRKRYHNGEITLQELMENNL